MKLQMTVYKVKNPFLQYDHRGLKCKLRHVQYKFLIVSIKNLMSGCLHTWKHK